MKPLITIHDALTGTTVEREMTDDEYQTLLDSGWTPGEDKPDDASEPA